MIFQRLGTLKGVLSDNQTRQHQPLQLVPALPSTKEKEKESLAGSASTGTTSAGHQETQRHPAGGNGSMQYVPCRPDQADSPSSSASNALHREIDYFIFFMHANFYVTGLYCLHREVGCLWLHREIGSSWFRSFASHRQLLSTTSWRTSNESTFT